MAQAHELMSAALGGSSTSSARRTLRSRSISARAFGGWWGGLVGGGVGWRGRSGLVGGRSGWSGWRASVPANSPVPQPSSRSASWSSTHPSRGARRGRAAPHLLDLRHVGPALRLGRPAAVDQRRHLLWPVGGDRGAEAVCGAVRGSRWEVYGVKLGGIQTCRRARAPGKHQKTAARRHPPATRSAYASSCSDSSPCFLMLRRPPRLDRGSERVSE
jgi:hypothetical protein